jgi:hypothetical protein
VYKIEGRYYGALKKPNLNFNDLDPLADSVSKFKIIELLQISAEGDQGPSLYALENLFGERPDNKVYKSLEPVAHGYLAFIADSKGKDVYGFIDSKGRVVIPFEYSSIEYTSGIFIASKEGRFGAFNTEGKILIPFVHSFLLVEDEGNSIIGKTENKDVRYNKEGVRQ